MAKVFLARYSGTPCGSCGDRIEEGDEVCYVDDELCHAQCAEEEGEKLYYD